MASIPRIREHKLSELPVIEGMVPDLLNLPPGCRFADRCHKVQTRCHTERPQLNGQTGQAAVACFFPE